jgi:hypothetical protein
LLALHITDDIVRGIPKAEPAKTALLVVAVFLYGTIVLGERRSGHVIMLLVGLFAAGMPVIHKRRSAGSGASPSSSLRADCGVRDGAGEVSPCCDQHTDWAKGATMASITGVSSVSSEKAGTCISCTS